MAEVEVQVDALWGLAGALSTGGSGKATVAEVPFLSSTNAGLDGALAGLRQGWMGQGGVLADVSDGLGTSVGTAAVDYAVTEQEAAKAFSR